MIRKKVSSEWIKHTKTDEERNKVKDAVIRSEYCLEILRGILEKELQEVDSTNKEDYKIAHWPCYQADRNGYKRAIKKFINLINLNESK